MRQLLTCGTLYKFSVLLNLKSTDIQTDRQTDRQLLTCGTLPELCSAELDVNRQTDTDRQTDRDIQRDSY